MLKKKKTNILYLLRFTATAVHPLLMHYLVMVTNVEIAT